MKLIPRLLEPQIKEFLLPNKVVVLLGPRRVGKTVLIRKIAGEYPEPYLMLNGEDLGARDLFKRRSIESLSSILDGKKFLIIDEAQKIPEIGQALKLMVDEIKGLKVLIAGSSSFDVENYTGEPLTGRKMTFKLYGISEAELADSEAINEEKDRLRDRLIYGTYPELLQIPTSQGKQLYLQELLNSYLLKDILAFETIRNSDKILDLLRLVAFQVGNEVSIPELSNTLGVSRNTIEKYLDLLSKVFILYKTSGFNRNLRKEVSKSNKYYFLDNGIRNILVNNLNPVALRNDVGALWENYMISERIKRQGYSQIFSYNYFWRTYDQQEIDWVEDRDGKLHGYEFKWNAKKKVKIPNGWERAYPDSNFQVIHPENYRSWLI